MGKPIFLTGLPLASISPVTLRLPSTSSSAENNNLDIDIKGINPLASFKLITKNWPATLTFYIQEMLKYNILASDRCYANFKHDNKSLQIYKSACEKVFEKIAKLEKKGRIENSLDGPIKQMGFNRHTDFKYF